MATAAPKKTWWVIWDASGTGAITIVQSSTKPAEPQGGRVFGPYATEAEARQEANPSSGLFGGVAPGLAAGASVGAGLLPGGGALPTLDNPLGFLGYLGEIGHWIGVFVTDITDVHMWISLGWLFLGLVLLVIGILLFLKHEDLLPEVAPVPVPV